MPHLKIYLPSGPIKISLLLFVLTSVGTSLGIFEIFLYLIELSLLLNVDSYLLSALPWKLLNCVVCDGLKK